MKRIVGLPLLLACITVVLIGLVVGIVVTCLRVGYTATREFLEWALVV